GDAQFTTVFSQTGSTRTLDTPAPTLSVYALGVSSIHWTWSTITGAQTYNLYYATGTLAAGGLTGTSTDEVGLSTNVAYGRQLSAVVNGIESALSAITTRSMVEASELKSRASLVCCISLAITKCPSQPLN